MNILCEEGYGRSANVDKKVEGLLNHGAEVDAKDDKGNTPLSLVIFNMLGNDEDDFDNLEAIRTVKR